MDYKLVAYEPRHFDRVVELQRHLWSRSLVINAKYFRWKYERNPYVGQPLAVLALHENRLVAMRGFWGALWEVGSDGPSHVVPCAGDTVIHPEHRRPRLELFEQLNRVGFEQMAARNLRYVFNLSSSRGVFLASLRTGWRSLDPYGFRARRLGLSQFGGRPEPLARWLGATPAVTTTLRSLRGVVSRRRVGPTTQSRKSRPKEMADLICRLGSDGRIRHRRDETYLSWRFDNPLSRYRFFFWGDSHLEGYLILQRNRFAPDRAIRIVDWEASSEEVRRGLLIAALRWVASGEVDVWSVTLPLTAVRLLEEFDFIAKSGYRATRRFRQAMLLNRPCNAKVEHPWRLGSLPLLDTANWDLRMVYSDAY